MHTAVVQPASFDTSGEVAALRPNGNVERTEPRLQSASQSTVRPADFDALYTAEYISMVRLAFTLVGRRDLAEEIVQDAFLEAHRRWARLASYDKPGAWIRRVVLQGCYRKNRRRFNESKVLRRLSLVRSNEPIDALIDAPLQAAIKKLPRRQAEVVALVAISDHSFAEAAGILGCSEETARTHMRRARVALREALSTADELRSSEEGR